MRGEDLLVAFIAGFCAGLVAGLMVTAVTVLLMR